MSLNSKQEPLANRRPLLQGDREIAKIDKSAFGSDALDQACPTFLVLRATFTWGNLLRATNVSRDNTRW